ncbi:MAG: type II toxin-antitoxin system prevent-host-death family antitoxin [Deltaproteobacteria bacterium]|nr:type II toxin-antitoxin system prevent-host-death family antitoxin [Deltaproteobacteria bacterium]
MKRAPRQMPAGEFKAKCLRVLDDVAASRHEVIVTKRGKPVAKVVPIAPTGAVPIEGLIVWQGDLVSPVGEDWDAER